MPIQAKYVHTNIVARDWRRLAKFYEEVLGCVPLPPERDYSGAWVNDVTAIVGDVSLRGIHLRLPGHGDSGPTLEIFEYSPQPPRPPIAANQPGFAHIAFHVSDVPAARQAILDAGGQDLGKLHTMQVRNAGRITLIYMTDPEGNIIELQHWDK
jgi:predicted enzyme related to lactoylglutathione lyase